MELTERRYARPTVSRTFEGRDRFAPAAAWLAKGIQLAALGRALHVLSPDSTIPRPEVGDATLAGVVLLVDRFGNLVTNIDRRTFETFARAHPVTVTVGGMPIARRRRHLRRHPGRRDLRAVRQHRSSRVRRQRRQRRGRAGIAERSRGRVTR